MWELTTGNALGYLRERGWSVSDGARADGLAGGVSGLVLRIEDGERRLVLKQARPRLRTRDEWFSDLERIYREQEVMELLGPLLPAGVVPRVLFADRERFVLAMQHAPEPSRNWKGMLLAGEVDAPLGEQAGRILGLIHETTARRRDTLPSLLDRRVFVQLRVDPFYRRVRERCPDVGELVAPLIDDLMNAREALCHGDFSPKNLLVHADGLTLVDYETGHLGEPAMDVGFFFSHLLLKALHRPADFPRFAELIRAAWRGYAGEIQYTSADRLLERGLRHLGLCVLARIDGTSPVDYLPQQPKREAARRLGRWLLRSRQADWAEVLERLESETCQLAGRG